MRAKKSNSRVAFAFQINAAQASILNPHLSNATTGNIVIRVVQPGDGQSSIARHYDYDGESATPVHHTGVDRLMSAVVKNGTKYTMASGADPDGGGSAGMRKTVGIYHIQADPSNDTVIIDILLSNDSILYQGINQYGEVIISLFFESGVEETIKLQLKDPTMCFLNPDPMTMSLGKEFDINFQPQGDILNSGSYFTAYNIGKAYRDVDEKGIKDPQYFSFTGDSNYSGFKSYSQPFGCIRTAALTGVPQADLSSFGGSDATWAQNYSTYGAFATKYKSSLFWFSGNSDMTQVYLDSATYSTPLTAAEEAPNQPIDFGKFFEFRPSFYYPDFSSPTEYDYRVSGPKGIWPAGPPRWGQNFGWFSTLQNNNIYYGYNTGVINLSGSNHILSGSDFATGAPLYFVNTQRAYYGSNNLTGNPGNPDNLTVGNSYYPSMFGGDFSAETPDTQSGFSATAETGFTTNSPYSIAGSQGPVATRFYKLFKNGTNSEYVDPLGLIVNDVNSGFLNITAHMLPNSVLNATPDNTGYFPKYYSIEGAKLNFWFIPAYIPATGSNGSNKCIYTGSVATITTSNNANFFYAGCAGQINGKTAEPIFRGTARTIFIERFGDGNSVGTLQGLVQAIASAGFTEFEGKGGLYANYLDMRGLYMASMGRSDNSYARLNPIDLLFSALYNNFGREFNSAAGNLVLPNPGGLGGLASGNTVYYSGQLRRWAQESLLGYTTFYDPVTQASIPGVGSLFKLYAQDIAFLNSAVNVISEETANVPYGAVLATHPICHPLTLYSTKNTTPPNVTTALNATTLSADTDQTSAVPPVNLASYDEGTDGWGYAFPPYPIVNTITPPVDKVAATYKNNKFTAGSGTSTEYNHPDVTNGGDTFTDNSGNYGGTPALPRVGNNTDGADYIVATGAAAAPLCLQVLSTSTEYKPVNISPTSNTDWTNSTNGMQVTLKMVYRNTCPTSLFHTAANTKTVSSSLNLATKVAKVLEIFPGIELNTMAAYAPNSPDGELAYKIILTDENDIDDCYIEEHPSQPNTYILTLLWQQGTNDVYNNPNDEFEDDVVIGGTQFFTDVLFPVSSLDMSDDNNWGNIYGSYLGLPEYGHFKGSWVTVSSRPDWLNQDPYSTNELDNSHFTIHTPYIGFGKQADFPGIQDALDESTAVYGCTDATAINYNPLATVDDDSCIDCQDEANGTGWNLSVQGLINDGLNGMRPGVCPSPDDTISSYILYGYVAGGVASTAFFDLTGSYPALSNIYNSSGANYGGAVVCNNAYVGEVANCQLDIKGSLSGGSSLLSSILTSQTLIDAGADHTSWQLRIIPATETLLDGLDLEYSYSETNPPPSNIVSAGHVYSAEATGGTITAPEWTNIVTPDAPVLGIKAGTPYILELKFAPKSIPAGCDTFNSDNTVIYGLMWTAFCACADVTNDYYYTALGGGNGFDWSSTHTFPIIGYPGGRCPDNPGLDNLTGDLAYPVNICFTGDQIDGNPVSCDNMFLFCIAQQVPTCDTVVDNLSEAYSAADGTYWYNLEDYTLILAIEGVYNYIQNGYVFNPNLQYTITVQSPGGTVYTQNQVNGQVITAGNGSQSIQNIFSGLTEAGTYTITWTFTGPDGIYPPYMNDLTPCVLTQTFDVGTPDEYCPEIVLGCTDINSPNYNDLAVLDDGSCLPPEEGCVAVLNNTALAESATSTNAPSICETDTIIVGGVSINTSVIVPLSEGTVTVTVVYSPPTLGAEDQVSVSEYAILLFPSNVANPYINTIIDSTASIFNSGTYPTSTTEGSQLVYDFGGGTLEVIGYWSNLFLVDTTSTTETYTFTGLPPGTYYYLAIPNLGDLNLNECSTGPVIKLEEEIQQIQVLADPPADPCTEDCVGTDCADWVPGCTNPDADNYNPDATVDDGSCIIPGTHCEENPDDTDCVDCTDGGQAAPRFSSGKLDEEICDPVNGSDGECTDPNACNYNPDAPLESSNNQICDYCSCSPEDPDCIEVQECDPDEDPDCGPAEPTCPDPGNPLCDPVIFDPCPSGECPPPPPPCVALGNCPPGPPGPPDGGGDPFVWDEPIVELTCIPQVAGVGDTDAYFDNVIQTAFKCMSDEGKKMLFRMKAGAQYNDEDLIKLSLIAYLLNGGDNFSELPCIFNCNYQAAQKSEVIDCQVSWLNKGARFWNSTDTFSRGDIVAHYYPVNGIVKRSIYIAQRTINPKGLAPRYQGSGWHRCKTVRVRTKDTNNIATGNETYLQTFWEFLTRFCTSCEVAPNAYNPAAVGRNDVDPKILQNHLTIENKQNPSVNGSGILGEDGEEITF